MTNGIVYAHLVHTAYSMAAWRNVHATNTQYMMHSFADW
jgi:hypothetical protein